MKKHIILLLGLALGIANANAGEPDPVLERVVLTDGTEYIGYIATRDFDGSKILFIAESAFFRVPNKNVYHENSNMSFPRDKADAAILRGFKLANRDLPDTIEYSNIMDGGNVEKVLVDSVIIVNVASDICYFKCMTDTISIPYSNISRICKQPLPQNQLSGIWDVVKYNTNDSIKGIVVEQVLGKSLKVEGTDSKSLDLKNVRKLVRTPGLDNKNQDIFSQTPFIEKIIMNAGTTQYTGMIKSQDYQKGTIDFLDKDKGLIVGLDSKDVKRIKRERNNNYKPIFAHFYDEDEISVNNLVVHTDSIDNDDFIIDSSKSSKWKAKASAKVGKVVVEYKASTKEGNNIEYCLCKLTNDKKDKKKKRVTPADVSTPIVPSLTYSGANMTHSEFNLEKGDYLLLRRGDNKACWIEVK